MPRVKNNIPTWEEFSKYASIKIKEKDDHPEFYTEWLKDKYDSWVEAGWKKSKTKGQKEVYVDILIWKTTLLQCLPFRVQNKVVADVKRVKPLNYNRGKLMEIDNEKIIDAWDYYSKTNLLKVSHSECFDILYKRKVFKNGKEISKKSGKPWQDWYNSLYEKALAFALAYGIDNNLSPDERNRIRNGNHQLNETFIKLEALKVYFKPFKTAFQLKQALTK